MRRLSLSSLAVLSLLSLPTPMLAEYATGAASVTAELVTQARAVPPTLASTAPEQVLATRARWPRRSC